VITLADQGSACGSGGASGNGSSGSSGNGIVLTGTSFAPIFGFFTSLITSESNGDQTIGAVAQTVSNLKVVLGTALGAAQTLTVTLRDTTAAVDEAVTCQVAALGTSCSDTTHSFSVPAGDLVTWKMVLSATTATTNIDIGAVIGAATTFSGNTSTAVSATTGVATAAANTPLLADGSGNATPAAPSNTVGVGGLWNNGLPLGAAVIPGSSSPIVDGTMYGTQLTVNYPFVLGHSTVYVVTGQTSEFLNVCLFNLAGTTLLYGTNFAVTTTGAAASGSGTQITVEPGVYLLTWEDSGGTAATMETYSQSGNIGSLMNKNGNRLFTTANKITGGPGSGSACPTTTGALTASVVASTDMIILLEP